MLNENFSAFTPDEALHAFMDCELDVSQEQQLFDELAANPELRREMKDVLAIRNSLLHDMPSPPDAVELGLLNMIGNGSALGSASAHTASAVSASSRIVGLMPVLYSLGGAIAGFAVAFFLFWDQNNTATPGNIGASYQPGPSEQSLPTQQPLNVVLQAPTDTIYSVRVVRLPASPVTTVPQEGALDQLSNTHSSVTSNETTHSSADRLLLPTRENHLQAVNSMALRSSGVPLSAKHAGYLAQPNDLGGGTLRLRSLASGLPANEPTPESVQSAVLPNTSFAFILPLNQHNRVGVEMGTESFRQQFSMVDDDGRKQNVLQTPVLFWIGGTYEYIGQDFWIPGLTPYGSATLGYAYSQGPVVRGTVGLSYNPVGPLRFILGLDASALAYQHQSQWFTSNKWGLSYGLSFDIP